MAMAVVFKKLAELRPDEIAMARAYTAGRHVKSSITSIRTIAAAARPQ